MGFFSYNIQECCKITCSEDNELVWCDKCDYSKFCLKHSIDVSDRPDKALLKYNVLCDNCYNETIDD